MPGKGKGGGKGKHAGGNGDDKPAKGRLGRHGKHLPAEVRDEVNKTAKGRGDVTEAELRELAKMQGKMIKLEAKKARQGDQEPE